MFFLRKLKDPIKQLFAYFWNLLVWLEAQQSRTFQNYHEASVGLFSCQTIIANEPVGKPYKGHREA